MARSQQWIDGRRHGIKWAVEFLHRRSAEMNDPHAKLVLDATAFAMGVEGKQSRFIPYSAPCEMCGDDWHKCQEIGLRNCEKANRATPALNREGSADV